MEVDILNSPLLPGHSRPDDTLCTYRFIVRCRIYGCLPNNGYILGFHFLQCSDGPVELYASFLTITYNHIPECHVTCILS